MTAGSNWLMRWVAAIVGAFALLAFIAAPALADTISPTEGQSFSGVVETSPTCAGTAATINWGDGSPTSRGTLSSGEWSGTHTYTKAGVFDSTTGAEVKITGGNCATGGTIDSLTADVADQPLTANSLTITPTATQSFSGSVASFTDAQSGTGTSDYSATINWGDGTTSSPADGQAVTISVNPAGGFFVNGTHTYATGGSYSIDVNITDTNQGGDPSQAPPPSTAETFSTATVAHAPPQFTQCPPVDANNGCQFLIIVNTSGAPVVEEDANQGPYESSDDALIGVQNNSSAPVSSLPLSVPSSDLFGFDGDGLCNPGAAPFPAGCTYPAGCTMDSTCSFPPPPGQPAGYVEPGAITGSSQNGYEGPTSWFSNVSADTSSGVVNFSPAIPPGQSTYFSLEEPPTGSAIIVGGGSTITTTPPTVTAGAASFSGTVVPGGSATTAYFEYGLDLKYTQQGASGPNYTNTTPVQSLGSSFSAQFVTASVSGLVPNALYHVRLVATNGAGTTFGPDQTFTTPALAPPGPPVLGKSFDASVVSGLVFILLPGGGARDAHLLPNATAKPGTGYIPLTQARQLPAGTKVDARLGTIKIVTATGKGHKTQTANFGGSIFKFSQGTHGSSKGLATVSLLESAFKGAPTFASCKGKAADVTGPSAQAAKLSSKVLQTLKASGHGKYRTSGRYGAATVLGTVWTITDQCNGTLIHDIKDKVLVQDLVLHKTITLHPGQSYLAKAPTGKHK